MKILKNEQQNIAARILTIGSICFALATLVACKDKNKKEQPERIWTDGIEANEINATIGDYVSFVNNDQNKMMFYHAYTSEALMKMTLAVCAIAGKTDPEINDDLEKAEGYVAQILDNPFETSHIGKIRKTALLLSGVLQTMQVAKYPGLSDEARSVRNSAAAIDPGTGIADQENAVTIFFLKGADLLDKMK
ncbi:hypothetical protein [Dyadobacter bucti]|uniref:hypothetical protein n=1 Tax=Dyadobacter bucti TaxID=2572203 RepID=UPI003F6F5760